MHDWDDFGRSYVAPTIRALRKAPTYNARRAAATYARVRAENERVERTANVARIRQLVAQAQLARFMAREKSQPPSPNSPVEVSGPTRSLEPTPQPEPAPDHCIKRPADCKVQSEGDWALALHAEAKLRDNLTDTLGGLSCWDTFNRSTGLTTTGCQQALITPLDLLGRAKKIGGLLDDVPELAVSAPKWLQAEHRVAAEIGIPRNGTLGLPQGRIPGSGIGGYRVPDFHPQLTLRLRGTVVEVKYSGVANPQPLWMSTQLAYNLAYAQANGGKLEIFTNRPLPTSGDLWQAIFVDRTVIVRAIP